MPDLAYLFERFPSFTQTFCYREVGELIRHGFAPEIFSIRRPVDEPPQDWDGAVVERVHYLPENEAVVEEVTRLMRKRKLPSAATRVLEGWGRKTDYLRLYQGVWIGVRLHERGVRHVHAHFAGMAARTAYWIKRFFGITFSFTAHANDIFAPKDFTVSLGALIEAASAVVAVSDFGAEFLREKWPAEGRKVHRIYNGIELSQFRRATFDAPAPVILSVGRLIEKKGFSDLVEACEILRTRGRAFRCLIVGEGPLENDLRAQIDRLNISDCVSLSGPKAQAEVIDLLAQATVFALPCVVEAEGGMDNLPTVIMEAMAAGLPVVSTPVAGVPEMVADGETGLLVPDRQPAALADAIERLISEAEVAKSLGQRGRELAEQLFAIESSARELAKLFAKLTEPR